MTDRRRFFTVGKWYACGVTCIVPDFVWNSREPLCTARTGDEPMPVMGKSMASGLVRSLGSGVIECEQPESRSHSIGARWVCLQETNADGAWDGERTDRRTAARTAAS